MPQFNSGSFNFKITNGIDVLRFYIPKSRYDVSQSESRPISIAKQLKNNFYGVGQAEVFGRWYYHLGALSMNDNLINYEYNSTLAGDAYVMSPAWTGAMLNACGITPSYSILSYFFTKYIRGFTDGDVGQYDETFNVIDEDGEVTGTRIYLRCSISRDNSSSSYLYKQSYSLGETRTIGDWHKEPIPYYYVTLQWSMNGTTYQTGIPCIDSSGHIAALEFSMLYENSSKAWKIEAPTQAYVKFEEASMTSTTMVSRKVYWAYEQYIQNYLGLSSVLLASVTEDEPLEPMGETEFGDTWGAYDFTTEDVTQSSMLSDVVLTSDMVKAYDITAAQLTSLHSKLFSQDFIDNLIKSFNNPMQAVLKLHQIPIAPYSTTSGSVYLGNYDTEITADRLTSRWSEWDSGNMSGIFEQEFGLSYDYDIQYELYLPFVNCIPLAVDDVLNGTLSCHYRVDMLTGQFICWVEVTKYNTMGYPYTAIIYQTTGNMSADMPITSGGYDAMGIMQGAFNIAGNLAVTAATGGANLAAGSAMTASQLHASQFGVGMDAAQGVAGLVNSAKPQYSFRGGMGGVATMQGRRKPFVKAMIPHPRAPHNYKNIIGFPSHISDAIGNFSGYAIFKNVILDVPSITPTEEESIRNLLHSGVYIESGSFATGSYLTDDVVLIQNGSDDRTIGKTLTAVETINGKWKAELDTETPSIIIESSTSTSAFNYLYIKALDRFYFVRGKSYLKDGVLSLQLAEDVLETYKEAIKSTNAYCVRSANKYNSLIQDTDAPLQVDKIIRYENFSNEFNSNHCILVTI